MKIKVLFTGGTIGSRINGGSISLSDAPPSYLLKGFESENLTFDTETPFSILSEEIGSHELVTLARCIEKNAADYDGFIITHGTDSIAYTAAFLSYLFGDSLPIAIVSSCAPLSSCHSNGRHNFAAALEYVRSGNKGVAVPWYYQGAAVIHHGARLFRQLPYDDLLQSLGDEVLFSVGGSLTGSWRENSGSGRLTSLLSLSDEQIMKGFGRVLYLKALPESCYPPLCGDISAVLIESYHSGTVCADEKFSAFVKSAQRLDIPVFIAGTGGRAYEYETAQKFRAAGAIPLPKASPDAMYVKLCMAVSLGEDIAGIMAEQCSGEIIPDADFVSETERR